MVDVYANGCFRGKSKEEMNIFLIERFSKNIYFVQCTCFTYLCLEHT